MKLQIIVNLYEGNGDGDKLLAQRRLTLTALDAIEGTFGSLDSIALWMVALARRDADEQAKSSSRQTVV